MSVRQHLLAILLLGVAACTLAADVAGRLLIERPLLERSLDRLLRETALMARELERAWPATPADADRWADLAAETLGVRISLLDASGRVLGDSQVAAADLPRLEPHADRPEVKSALAGAHGEQHRVSSTLDRDMHYVAHRVGSASSPRGVVRAAADAEALQAPGRRYRRAVTATSLACFMALAFLADLAARRTTRALATITRAAEGVSEGRLETRISVDAREDLVQLSAALERMRRAMAERLRHAESEQRLLSAILGGLREGILVVNSSRRVLLINEPLIRSLNLPERVPEGIPLIQLIWDRDVIEPFEEALTRGDEVRRRVTMPGGVAFELTVVPLDDARSGPGAIGLFFNITRLEALERVRRDFVADISHELRTPLASIKASAETLQAGAIDDRREAALFLGILAKNTLRMEAILNDLTDLSLIETGSIKLEREPVDMAGAVREAAAAVATRATARQVTVSSDVPAGLTILADRRRLDQILVNLLDNAVKFNRPGGTVRILTDRTAAASRIVIEDTGPGIPPDALERIFNRFYRLDRARSRDVPGTGLGLAIVKHLMRLHDGDIRAENLPTAGARFILEFPATPPAPPRDPRKI